MIKTDKPLESETARKFKADLEKYEQWTNKFVFGCVAAGIATVLIKWWIFGG